MSLQVAKSREAVRSMTLPRCGDGAVPKIRDRTRSASRIVLADLLVKKGARENLLEAEGLLRAALPDWQMLLGESHYGARNIQTELASILRREGKETEANELLNQPAAGEEKQ